MAHYNVVDDSGETLQLEMTLDVLKLMFACYNVVVESEEMHRVKMTLVQANESTF